MANLADTLVTGASRGMGRATALALAFAGARVIVQYGRNADESQCGGRSMSAHPIFRTDMSNLTEPEEAHWITGDTIAVDGGSKL
jgi:NAD(P)-dependent dehydrogenase (short-subunit alcohol dehydrogenase family)